MTPEECREELIERVKDCALELTLQAGQIVGEMSPLTNIHISIDLGFDGCFCRFPSISVTHEFRTPQTISRRMLASGSNKRYYTEDTIDED